MTDAEWYEHDPPWMLLKVAASRARKARLFMAGSVRTTGAAPMSPQLVRSIELAEEYADGRGTKSALTKARASLRGTKPVYPHGWRGTDYLLWCALNPDWGSGLIRFEGAWMWAVDTDRLLPEHVHQRDAQSGLMLDIFGNPFRPVPRDPSWLTSDVMMLARGMYESRDFAAMPILADALQDAGCQRAEVLDHCRGSGPHVRGCWVVDLVLGKD